MGKKKKKVKGGRPLSHLVQLFNYVVSDERAVKAGTQPADGCSGSGVGWLTLVRVAGAWFMCLGAEQRLNAGFRGVGWDVPPLPFIASVLPAAGFVYSHDNRPCPSPMPCFVLFCLVYSK